MVGLHYLKALYGESDESVVAKWIENPYWQYFCGEQEFQHDFPCHPTSLVKWRKQIGVDGFEQLLGQIIQTAMRTAVMKPKEIEGVNVDTTVQEKVVAFPTDARLYNQARITLVRAARKRGIKLRQSYAIAGIPPNATPRFCFTVTVKRPVIQGMRTCVRFAWLVVSSGSV